MKHVKVEAGAVLIRPAGGEPDVTIPLHSIREVKLPFGRAIIRTNHSRHDLDITNLDLKEFEDLNELLLETVKNNRKPNQSIHALSQ